MGSHMGKFQAKDLEKLKRELEKKDAQLSFFLESCAKELAARLLAKVVKRTPVGVGVFQVVKGPDGTIARYKKGKRAGEIKLKRLRPGGVLRRGWISKTQQEAENEKGSPSAEKMIKYINGLAVEHTGDQYRIFVSNVVEWSSYVEYGHRQQPGRFVPVLGKRLKKAWVPGVFILTISEKQIRTEAPDILEKKIKQFLGDTLS